MELQDDKNGVKDRILDDLGKSIKLVQRYALCGYEGIVVIGNDSWLVQSLCHLLDLVLRHGLRDLHRGYWPIVREFSHSDTRRIIQSLKSVSTSLGKGRAWLYYTLTEGSLQSYLECLCRDLKILHRHYITQALLRDTPRTQQLLTLLAGLEQVQFNLDPDVAYLDMAAYQQQHSEVSSDLLPSCGDPSNLGPRMTSSITSSLASPVDSGVALLDSDADATSVSEATINETDTISLRDDKDDDSSFNEIEDNRINHQLLSLETTAGKMHVEEENLDIKSCSIDNDRNSSMDTVTKRDVPDTTLHGEAHLNKDHRSEFNTHPSDRNPIASSNDDVESTKHHQLHNEDSFGCEHLRDLGDSVLACAKSEKGLAASAGVAKPVEKELDEQAGSHAIDSPESELMRVSEVLRSRNFSIMTASDIANQNIGEDGVAPSGVLSHGPGAATSFVESKNRVNAKLSSLEDVREEQKCIPAVKNDYNELRKLKEDRGKAVTDGDDIVFRRQRNKKRNNACGGSTAADGTTKVKRVSFHEDFVTNEHDGSGKCQPGSVSDFSVSFLPPDSVIKRDVIKGRYSWCGEGDAPFVRRRNNESDTKSDIYLSSSTLTSSDETICTEDQTVQANKSATVTSLCNSNQQYTCNKERDILSEVTRTPPVTERGTPEGQEDPPNCASSLCLHSDSNRKQSIGGTLPEAIRRLSGSLKKFPSFPSSVDCFSDSESVSASDTEFVCSRTGHLISTSFKENCFIDNYTGSSSLLDVRMSKPRRSSRKSSPLGLLPSRDVASKTSLLNRFMRSITEKKFVQRKPKVTLKPSRSLYIPGIKKPDDTEMLERFKTELDMEMRLSEGMRQVCQEKSDLEETFRTRVFRDCKEVLYKVFKVSSSYCNDGIGKPLLALLTNMNLYLTGVKSNYTYCNHLIMPYTELDAMLVGPNSQTLLLVSSDRQTQFLIVTGDRAVTEQLVGHIEIAMRCAPTKPALPAVRILELEDMESLSQGLAHNISLLEDEAICHYSMVHLQDDHVSPPSTPMGPTKEGHLMFRPATDAPLQPWQPGFFMLKAGVVYMFGDKSHRLPRRVIPLRGNACRGCRRIPHAQRPHTFEILLGPRRSFQFAAADEYEASDWLQAFVQAASGVCEEERINAMACSLVVTERHLVTCQETLPTTVDSGSGDVRILSCAAIRDLTAFIVDSFQHSWCVLEFACREVHESSGDWVLYFASSEEMCSFKDILQQLWLSLQQTEFPLCPLVDVSLGRRCVEMSTLLSGAWDVLLPVSSHASL